MLTAVVPHEAGAQQWSIDLSAGRVVYDPVAASVGTTNLLAALRYDTGAGVWLYGAVAPPLGGKSTTWGATGLGGRATVRRPGVPRAAVGLDFGAHGFLFRDVVASRAGQGAAVDALPFASLPVGSADLELRAGWRGQTLSVADAPSRRGVFETGARLGAGASIQWQADMRWVHAPEGTFPFAGVTVAGGDTRIRVWAHAGRWLRDGLGVNDVTWGVGAQAALGPGAVLWASVRRDAPDPLYWNPARSAWSVGVTQRLGRAPASRAAVPTARAGRVRIRVAADESPDGGAPSIAGDFNRWRPVPMRRDGDDWVIDLALTAGVYHYAFRAADGTWFVPDSVNGRRDDGMGGQVAVLVVR